MFELREFARERPVLAFFLGAYLYTWVVTAPAVVLPASWPAAILVYVGSFGAPISAAVVTWLRGDDVRAWARQLLVWRVGARWWLVALGLPLVAAGAMTAVLVAIGGPVDLTSAPVGAPMVVGIFLFALVLSGGLNEEPGWRGFAQARLQERYSALGASLLIGVAWAGWHLPYFFAPVTPQSSFPLVNQIGWLVGILTLSVLLAWLYNTTGSVLLPMVLHAMANTADVVIPLDATRLVVGQVLDVGAVGQVVGVHVAVYVVIVVLVVAVYGHRRLARGSVPGPADVGAQDR